MKRLFIVNESAGKGRTKKMWSKIRDHLMYCNIQFDVHFTSKSREATEIAKSACDNGYTHVIAVGGDGTVNEVVNGISGRKTVFGVIPTGTGNDLARMLKISKKPIGAVRKIWEGTEKQIDLLEMNGKYIAGAVGIGFDGAVAEDINRTSWKKKAGSFGYILSMLKLILTFTPFTLYLDVDNRSYIFRNCWLVAIGNAKFYGGGMEICPTAEMDDGLLDVCVVHDLHQIELLKLFPSVFSGKHIRDPRVLCFRGKAVRVLTDPAVPVHGDGEMLGSTPSEIIVRPSFLKVIS